MVTNDSKSDLPLDVKIIFLQGFAIIELCPIMFCYDDFDKCWRFDKFFNTMSSCQNCGRSNYCPTTKRKLAKNFDSYLPRNTVDFGILTTKYFVRNLVPSASKVRKVCWFLGCWNQTLSVSVLWHFDILVFFCY